MYVRFSHALTVNFVENILLALVEVFLWRQRTDSVFLKFEH